MTAILEKYFTREYSLFCVAVWCEANTKLASEWVNYNSKNVLFINEGHSKKFSVWYDPKEDFWDKNIVELINADPTYFDRLKTSFYEHFDAMLSYDSGKTPIASFADLKSYLDHYLKWWTPMAIIMHLPNLSPIPEAAKQEAIKIREATQAYSDADDKVFAPFIQKNFPEYTDLVPILMPTEILSLEQGRFSPEKLAKINERKNGYVYFNNQIYPLNNLNKILDSNDLTLEDLSKQTTSITKIKGSSASKGFVTGKARLVLYKKDLSSVEEGEILVTEMTMPEFVPAMKKAGGIVTDEGGITCHAAIASREMNKPCVIGTKIATKVLKNGDMIEVDANKGVVTILEK